VPLKTRVLVAPFALVGIEERMSREKLCPVLGYHVAKNRNQAMSEARAILRLTGAGHSAAVHAGDPQVVMEYARIVESYRIVVNAPCSQGAAGLQTHLAPAFTIGTGYFGHSSIGENIGPQHLVHWSRVAYNSDAAVHFPDFESVNVGFEGPLPSAPAGGLPHDGRGAASARATYTGSHPRGDGAASGFDDQARNELRRLIAEEIRNTLKGGH
jgi:hypothetical protein